MKTLNVALLSLCVLATSVQARSTNSPGSGPIYSTHDYKHPNVAAVALHWENNTALRVKKSTCTDTQLTNYKSHLTADQPGGSVTLPYTRQTDLSNRNYKNPLLNDWQSANSEGDFHVKKHHKNHHMTVGH